MAEYLITFQPKEPHFFGNDRIFNFPGNNVTQNPYFIVGETTPLQSSVFGSLRYLLLEEKGYDKISDPRNVAVVGSESLNILSDQPQTFGMIKNMSPIFLIKNDREWFVPTPFDHNVSNEKPEYDPFSNYKPMQTPEGEKLFTEEYDVKAGTESSYMSLDDAHLEKNLFTASIRIGINRKAQTSGLFKREFKQLKVGYAFAVIANLDKEIEDGYQDVVMMGQCKTPFLVRIKKYVGVTLEERIRNILSKARANIKYKARCIYFPADTYLDVSSSADLYKDMLFGVTQIRTCRVMSTSRQNNATSVRKGAVLIKLIKAGSVLIPSDQFQRWDDSSLSNAKTAGLHNYVLIEKD